MELAYYESRLIYDMSREYDANVEPSKKDDYDHNCKQISQVVQSSISQLVNDIVEFIGDDFEGGQNHEGRSAFDILLFAERQLESTRKEVDFCNQNLLNLADTIQTLKTAFENLTNSSQEVIDESNTNILNADAYIRATTFWLRGAEAKLKLHTLELLRETYLSDDNAVSNLEEIKQRLNSRRALQQQQREKIITAKEKYESLPPKILSDLLALRRRKQYLLGALENIA